MLLTIDNLADRYKLLPSEIIERASTFDLYVLDISSKWLKYQHEEAERERKGQPKTAKPPKLTQEQMMAMIQAVKERKK